MIFKTISLLTMLVVGNDGRVVTTPSGLQYADAVVGTGEIPSPGQECIVHYTGWLWIGGRKGAEFDSSHKRSTPFKFTLGAGNVIKGWDEGVATMGVGGKRVLVVPSGLAYGGRSMGNGLIPPNSTLCFEIELLGIR